MVEAHVAEGLRVELAVGDGTLEVCAIRSTGVRVVVCHIIPCHRSYDTGSATVCSATGNHISSISYRVKCKLLRTYI